MKWSVAHILGLSTAPADHQTKMVKVIDIFINKLALSKQV